MLIPVVILFSPSALCRIIRGMVTTPPPRDSRSTVPALMTVIGLLSALSTGLRYGGYSEVTTSL
jgi:hypothetical protein